MNLDQAVDKALELLSDPKNDKRRTLMAFANTAIKLTPPPVSGGCAGCGRPNPLCASCAVKHAIGNAAVNLVQGLGEIGQPQPAPPTHVRPRRNAAPPAVYQGPINLGRVKAVEAQVRDAKPKGR